MLFSEWVTQIVAFLIVGSCFISLNYFGTSAAVIVNELSDSTVLFEVVLSFFVVFSLLFTLPLIYGLVNFEINAIVAKKAKLYDLFSAFSDMKGMVRSYALFLQVFGRCILCFLPAALVVVFNEFFYESVFLGHHVFFGIDIATFLCNTLFFVFLYLGIVFMSGCFVGIYLTVKNPEMSVDECFFKAKKCIKGNRSELTKTALSFLPLFVVSLFSMGLLFAVYTLPYMLITLIMVSKYICDKYVYKPETERNDSEQISE